MLALIAYCAAPVKATLTRLRRKESALKAKKMQLTDDIARSELYPHTPSYTYAKVH